MEQHYTNPAAKEFDEKINIRITSFSKCAKNDDDLISFRMFDRSLHELARYGNVKLMQQRLKKFKFCKNESLKEKLAQQDADGLTPLHYAARFNHFEMCKLLIQNGSELDARDNDNMTPMHFVAKYKPKTKSTQTSHLQVEAAVKKDEADNVEILNHFLKNGADVNAQDLYGLGPLHHACLRGNEVITEALLSNPKHVSISVDAGDEQQMTPLHIAVVYGHFGITELLLKSRAKIDAKDVENKTPLHLATSEGNQKIVELLINMGQKNHSSDFVFSMLKDKDNDGNTAFHLAVISGHEGISGLLVGKANKLGRDRFNSLLNATKFNQETPLHLGARKGNSKITELLIQSGAQIDEENDNGSTPLILAAKFNHFDIVKRLVENGAKIDAKDDDGCTALLIAARHGHSETIKTLNELGADATAVDKQKRNILHQCANEGRMEAMQEIMQNKKKIRKLLNATDICGNTPLHAAASSGHFTLLQVLFEAQAAILKNDDEQTPLHLAAIHGRVEVIKELLGYNKIVIRDIDKDYNTAIHLAAFEGHSKCVKELVDAGASVNSRNMKQWTPLDCCALKGHMNCALVLLESGSPVDPKDKRSITPLHISCEEGHVKMVKLLLKWNADVSIRSCDGRNALDFAIDYGNEDCALAIIESSQWRQALRNVTETTSANKVIQTPMRKLIKKMPKVTEIVFKNCSETKGLPEHKDFEIKFDFEFLEDEYTCSNWKDKKCDRAKPCSHVHSDALQHQNHCLMIMVMSKREALLRHPLVLSLLSHKWESFGRTVYYSSLILYSLFMLVFNSYMLTVPAPFAINSTATLADGSCVKVVDAAQDVWGSTCTLEHSYWRPIAQWITVGLVGLSMLKEFFQMIGQKWKYFLSITNLLELTLYVSCILTVVDFTDYSRNTGIREAWQWQCGAFAIFLSWMGFLLFIQKFPRFGIFVLMFTDVFKTFFSFFGVFLLFIFGFAFSFHTLLQNQFAFAYWWNSIIKTMVMMIGEFEYDDLFNSEFTSTAYSDQVNYGAVSYIIFVLFLLIMNIIIMNLLVGLAVDDIKEVQDHAELERLAMQVKLTLDVEYTLPYFFRRSLVKTHLCLEPNKHKPKNRILRYFLKNRKLSAENINQALMPVKGDLDEIEDKVKNIERQMKRLETTMNSGTEAVETMLKAIMNRLKIDHADDQDDQYSQL